MAFDFGAIMSGLSGLNSLFDSIFGGISADQRAKWSQGLATQVLNTLTQNLGAGQGIFNSYSGFVGPNASQNITNLMNQMWGDGSGFLPTLQNQLQYNNGLITDKFNTNGQFQTPMTQNAQNALMSLIGGIGGTGDLASQVFAGGGWSPQSQSISDQLNTLLTQTNPGNRGQVAGDVASEFLNNRGNTQFTNLMQQFAQSVLGAGGFTPTLNAAGPAITNLLNSNGNTSGQDVLRSAGSNVLNQNGLTPTGQFGESAALQGINSGGTTPITSQLAQGGLDMFNKNNLLDPLAAAMFAGNDAMQNYKGQIEALYNKALARGGGPGANVASGMQSGAAGDFADQALAARSKAVVDALMQSQGLNLQQTQTGANTATSATNTDTNRLKTFSDLLTSLEGVASNRFGTGGNLLSTAESLNNSRLLGGLNFIPELQNSATSNLGTTGNLGLGAGTLANKNIGTSTIFNNIQRGVLEIMM